MRGLVPLEQVTYYPVQYYERMRVSNYVGAKKVETFFESPEASVKRRTNAHELAAVANIVLFEFR